MKLIYVYDPLCGWCYGFSATIERFVSKYEKDFEVEVISGGMVTGSRIGPIGEVAPYISWAYKDVEQATGVKFGSAFIDGTLKDGKAIFTSIPPSLALTAFKTLLPKKQLAFAAKLQKAIYYDGIEPLDLKKYGALAAEFGLNAENFVELMTKPTIESNTQMEFRFSAQMGVKGFPTVFLMSENQYYILTNGAVSLETLEKNYLKTKSKIQK